MNSITMYGAPSSVWSKSVTSRMFGWRSRLAARASRRNRSYASAFSAIWGSSIFTATFLSSSQCTASYTDPMPPCPSRRTIWYRLPSTFPMSGSMLTALYL